MPNKLLKQICRMKPNRLNDVLAELNNIQIDSIWGKMSFKSFLPSFLFLSLHKCLNVLHLFKFHFLRPISKIINYEISYLFTFCQNNFILQIKKYMKLSRKTTIINGQSIKRFDQKPRDIVNRLNKDISSIQNAVRQYNLNEQKAQNWKKQYKLNRINGNSTHLKALTQPKLQNILLESNFINNSALFKNINESFMKKSMSKSRNLSKKTSFCTTSLGLRKTFSFMNPKSKQKYSNRENEHQNIKQLKDQQSTDDLANPESHFAKATPNFASFREQVNKFDKLAYLSKNNYNKNYSYKPQNTQHGKNRSNSLFSNNNAESIMFTNNQRDNETVIGSESKSIMMQSSLNPFTQVNNYSKESLLFTPITEEKSINLSQFKNSRNIRRRIEQKTMELQRQWVKTQGFRQKFNICKQPQSIEFSRSKRASSKLNTIIQKVQQRRPATTMNNKGRAYMKDEQENDSNLNKINNRVNSSPQQLFCDPNYYFEFLEK